MTDPGMRSGDGASPIRRAQWTQIVSIQASGKMTSRRNCDTAFDFIQ
jgi:hypothetical protein